MRRLALMLLCAAIMLSCTSATSYTTEYRMQPKLAQHTVTHRSQLNTVKKTLSDSFTEHDVILIAKTIYGEAGSDWISYEEKACVAWVILNRVDDPRWPNTVEEVVTAENQFHGYSEYHAITYECYGVAKDVLIRWSLEKMGYCVKRELAPTMTAFYGDGHANHFYEY